MTQPPTPIRINPNGPDGAGLEPWEDMNPNDLISGTPKQSGYLCDEIEDAGYLAGVWHCTAYTEHPGAYEVDEYMLLLEGQVIMRLADGTDITVSAGEAFVIPQGLECQWIMPGPVRKIFMILEQDAVPLATNPSLTRITLPNLAPIVGAAGSGAVECRETSFANADGRMRVIRRDYPGGQSGPCVVGARRLVTVLEGRVSFGTPKTQFAQDETYYLHPGIYESCEIVAGTRLIEARFAYDQKGSD